MNKVIIEENKDERVRRNWRLRYFYLIDVNTIKKKLKTDTTLNSYTDITQRFKEMFRMILDIGDPYINFLFSSEIGPYHSVFGDTPGNSEVNTLMLLAQTAMFHQCILDEYKKQLLISICDIPEVPIIKLSASTVPIIKKGYFSINTKEDVRPSLPSEKHQNFYSKTKNFLTRDAYSTQLLESLRHLTPEQTQHEIHVYKTECTPASFLLEEKNVHFFDTQLKKNTFNIKFAQTYNAVKTSYENMHSTLSFKDKILFDMILDPAYGFSFFNCIDSLFFKMENISDPYYRLRFLKGETFNSIIAKYEAQLPIVYNKFMFLKYAFKAIDNSSTLNSMYLSNSMHGVQYDSALPLSEVAKATKALDSLDYFFHLLLHTAIPLIKDLWSLLSETMKVSLSDYENFINENYKTITFNYDTIESDLISPSAFATTFVTYYDALKTYINNNPSGTVSNDKYILSHKTPYYQDICKIIQLSCSNKYRIQSEPIANSLMQRSFDFNDPYYHEQKKFILNHARNIADYCRRLH